MTAPWEKISWKVQELMQKEQVEEVGHKDIII